MDIKLLDRDDISIHFTKIDNGYEGTLFVDFPNKGKQVEVISEKSLYIFENILSRIVFVLKKHELSNFVNERERDEFAGILNYNCITDPSKRALVTEILMPFEQKIAHMHLFNSMNFLIVGETFYLNWYCSIRQNEEIDFWDIDESMIDAFIVGPEYECLSIELSSEELIDFAMKIDDLIEDINISVFNYRDYVKYNFKMN